MGKGNIVEFIDGQKFVCAVVLEENNNKIQVLTETGRDVNLSQKRLSHISDNQLELSAGKYNILESLKKIANFRKSLSDQVDIPVLWKIFSREAKWVSVSTMTEFCFPEHADADHEAAVIRAFFYNRIYFKFDHNRFFPNSEEKVENTINQAMEAERRQRVIENGAVWLKQAATAGSSERSADIDEYITILKSYYIFQKDSPHYGVARQILSKAGVDEGNMLFNLFVKLGVLDKNENLDLYRYCIPVSFSEAADEKAKEIVNTPELLRFTDGRRDLTSLPAMTIDGQATLDFDDAISIEKDGDAYRLGIHIMDVGHFVPKGGILDKEALSRVSSIYMPDNKIPMFPKILSENICSLKDGEPRPAISIIVKLSPFADVVEYDILPSVVSVKRQMNYYETNQICEYDEEIKVLYALAKQFRARRLRSGAVHLTLPEINVWLEHNGEVKITAIDRESPGRMLVAEFMIMANWLMGKFLAGRRMPAIYRSQIDPRSRIIKGNNSTLFQNCMQRRQLNRVLLGLIPEHHSGLGLDVYVTATSPIRKYIDLVTQRQVRAAIGLEAPYSEEEIKNLTDSLEQRILEIGKVQFLRNRYWILKYLENKTGQKEEAVVLEKRRHHYNIIIPAYMIECDLPQSSRMELKPGDLIQITIQHVNARNDVISVYMG